MKYFFSFGMRKQLSFLKRQLDTSDTPTSGIFGLTHLFCNLFNQVLGQAMALVAAAELHLNVYKGHSCLLLSQD